MEANAMATDRSAKPHQQRHTVSVELMVNGRPYRNDIEPRLLLVHYIRDVLGLTGTHVGCDTSQCGACTVSVDDLAVKSCTVFAVQANGAQVTTIEGLAGTSLHPLQESFRQCHGLQCGFCTSGMIMACRQLLERYPVPTEEQVRSQLDGNMCRCTGYHNIVKAVLAAAEAISQAKKPPSP